MESKNQVETEKILNEIFIPVKNEEAKISPVSKWSENRSETSRFSKASGAISSVSKWSDNQSDKEEEIMEKSKPEIIKADLKEETL